MSWEFLESGKFFIELHTIFVSLMLFVLRYPSRYQSKCKGILRLPGRLFGLTVARNASQSVRIEEGGGPPRLRSRWCRTKVMWSCRSGSGPKCAPRHATPLLLNFCVRLRSKLSKINFHFEKLQIARKAAKEAATNEIWFWAMGGWVVGGRLVGSQGGLSINFLNGSPN